MSAKYSILHIIETLERGGAELRLLEDIKNLSGFKHTVCYLFKERNELEEEFKNAGAKIYCLSLHYRFGLLLGFIRFFLLIKKCRPDIIHTHLFYANIISRLACIFYPKVAYVQTIHAPDYKKNGGYLYSRSRYILELFTLMLKKPKFIAVSEYVKEESLKSLRINREEVKVIYNYLSDGWFSHPVSQKKENNPKRIISVTHLHKQKGIEYLIRAMSVVLGFGKLGSLSIVGDGPEKQYLSGLIKSLKLEKNIFLLGKRNDVQKLVFESDIFIFPSIDEGLGIALIEAMSQGNVSLAFNVGPMPEIVEDGYDGFLVRPRSVDALAEKIVYIIDNYSDCEEISKRARLKAKDKFSKERSVALLAGYYKEILNNH